MIETIVTIWTWASVAIVIVMASAIPACGVLVIIATVSPTLRRTFARAGE